MKLFKKIGIISIVLFSFYYTEQIANFVLESNHLYKEIDEKKERFEVKSIAAVIEDDYIIPGLTGLTVNIKDSYYNMKSLNVFNSYYLVYKDAWPVVSINDNKDKIIRQGNKEKNSIALVLEYDEKIIEYLKKYNFSVLTNMNTFDKTASYEQINNEVGSFKRLESLINKYVTNPNICIINSRNESVCRENKKFLVDPNKILSDSTVLSLKDNIESGDIILIEKNTKLNNVETILKSILYKDYKINFLSNHISEERD